MSKTHTYEGQSLTIHYDVRRCIHAASCVRGMPAVFNTRNKPWVAPDAAAVEATVAIVHTCPSGALAYQRKDGGPAEPVPSENVVRVTADGPVYVRGDLEIEAADGTVRHETRAALCRCGASHNKPYCDNSHRKADWSDAGTVGTANPKDVPEGATALRIKVRADGSLGLSGPYRVEDASGTAALETGAGSLCRCGKSQNRPFCDGSHKGVFVDPGLFAG